MNPSQLEDKLDTQTPQQQDALPAQEAPRRVPPRRAPQGGFAMWLDELRCNLTVNAWRRREKKKKRRSAMAGFLHSLPYAGAIGEILYMVGFWAEYVAVCMGRWLLRVAGAVLQHAGSLLLMILRPFFLGLITFLEDIIEPFSRMHSGLRHIRELPGQLPTGDAKQIRSEKIAYFLRGAKMYYRLLFNLVGYLLPVAAAVVLVNIVQSGMSNHFVLNVQVNGESVGYVENEQVFDNARDEVQARVNNAKAMLQEAGAEVADEQWEITPTYTLAIMGETMTQSEAANAIMRASSNEISEGTAVYVDGVLQFVTTEGDHLRTYLEHVKAPYQEALDPNVTVNFVHDIQLVDGVYLLSSLLPYNTVTRQLREGSDAKSYIAQEGDTVQTVLDATGLSFEQLAAYNDGLDSPEQVLAEGAELVTGIPAAELLKVKTVVRSQASQTVPYETVETESGDLDFGKREVVQAGQEGENLVTYDTVYIDGELSEVNVVRIDVVREPVTEQIQVGTRLKNGMTGSIGSGTFVWPVPQFTYVSRWMSASHRGADICAPVNTPIIASDGGQVITAGWHNSYGNYVVIDHGNGYQTLYAHMNAIAVTQGQSVAQSQVIGYVGSTGNSTGYHCHFEMYGPNGRFSAREVFPYI